jgi:hypothetical protein
MSCRVRITVEEEKNRTWNGIDGWEMLILPVGTVIAVEREEERFFQFSHGGRVLRIVKEHAERIPLCTCLPTSLLLYGCTCGVTNE